MHGPYLGPDGYFYWCKGAFQKQSHKLSDGRLFTSSAAHVYRARLALIHIGRKRADLARPLLEQVEVRKLNQGDE